MTEFNFRKLEDEIDAKKGSVNDLNNTLANKAITIVGMRRTTSRFLPVSHEGFSNETYVDKEDVRGEDRASFIARKQKAIERRQHAKIFRQTIVDQMYDGGDDNIESWEDAYKKLGLEGSNGPCTIPGDLCVSCPNCSLFGALNTDAGGGWFSKARYFDTFSVEAVEDAVATEETEDGMAIGNQVSEDLENSEDRSSSSLFYYEYVRPDTHFPFITVIQEPTKLDLAAYFAAHQAANNAGFGQYSAVNGKFDSEIMAVAQGFPQFSVLDMLDWADNSDDVRSAIRDTLDKDKFEGAAAIGDDAQNTAENWRGKVENQVGNYLSTINSNGDE
jgi:CRISPR type I-D-associated protein Csc2